MVTEAKYTNSNPGLHRQHARLRVADFLSRELQIPPVGRDDHTADIARPADAVDTRHKDRKLAGHVVIYESGAGIGFLQYAVYRDAVCDPLPGGYGQGR